MTEPAVRVRNLTNAFGEHIVHDGLDCDIRKGEILGVVGGSGSGKSVWMRSIIGLQRPHSGEIEIFGTQTNRASRSQLMKMSRNIGVMFQGGALLSSLTVEENVMLPLMEHTSLPPATIREIAALKIALTGLPPEAHFIYPSSLSGGMRKRAALARALALEPQLIFLDEPTAGLDPLAAEGFDSLITELHRNLGFTAVMITHDLDSLFSICHRIAVLVDKKMIIGTPAEITSHPHPWIRSYFHSHRALAVQKYGETVG